MENTMDKVIITVVGKDTVGIIAKVCTYLAENKINILDISQTIVQGYFNMMMIVDTNATEKAFAPATMSEHATRALHVLIDGVEYLIHDDSAR